jgi:abequosyltransferase
MSNPILSCDDQLAVAIPIYKRPELFSRCLDSVLVATQPFGVPIYIYDDSLSDINVATVQLARLRYDKIFFIRNEFNLGIDENIAKCMESTPVNYIWLMGEDDLMVPDAVKRIIYRLRLNEYPFIFVNYSYISNDYSKIIRERRLNIDQDLQLEGREFFERYLWAAGFIGGCIIGVSEWKKVDRAKYKGTFFSHVGVISEMIAGRSIYLISMPLILNRAEDVTSTSWAQQSFDVNFGWDRMIAEAGHLYGIESLHRARNSSTEIFWHRSLIFLASKRADGIFNLRIFRKYIRSGEFTLLFRLVSCLLAVAPKSILFKLKKIYRKRIGKRLRA